MYFHVLFMANVNPYLAGIDLNSLLLSACVKYSYNSSEPEACQWYKVGRVRVNRQS